MLRVGVANPWLQKTGIALGYNNKDEAGGGGLTLNNKNNGNTDIDATAMWLRPYQANSQENIDGLSIADAGYGINITSTDPKQNPLMQYVEKNYDDGELVKVSRIRSTHDPLSGQRYSSIKIAIKDKGTSSETFLGHTLIIKNNNEKFTRGKVIAVLKDDKVYQNLKDVPLKTADLTAIGDAVIIAEAGKEPMEYKLNLVDGSKDGYGKQETTEIMMVPQNKDISKENSEIVSYYLTKQRQSQII